MKRNEHISFHAVFLFTRLQWNYWQNPLLFAQRKNSNELRKDSLVVFTDTLYNKMGCYIEKRKNTDSKRKLIYE